MVVPDEKSLLYKFFAKWEEINPTIILGWNIDYFDNPYLYFRAKRVMGANFAKKLSPLGYIKKTRPNEFGQIGIKIAGVSSLDCMRLYKKFTFGEKSSYSLDNIAKAELGRGKVEYEGNLQTLYETDPVKFVEYNITDVDLVVEIESKKDLVGQVLGICHKGHVPYEDIYYSSKYLEGAALCFMRQIDVIAPLKKPKAKFECSNYIARGATKIMFDDNVNKNVPGSGMLKIVKSKSSEFIVHYTHWTGDTMYLSEPLDQPILPEYEIKIGLPGAYVKEPVPGRYNWFYDLDLTSLYPSIIMSLNISPETKVGRFLDWNGMDYVQNSVRTYKLKVGSKTTTMTHIEVREYLESNRYLIAANGVHYIHPDVQKGFLPTILEKWFDERVEYKNLMKKYGKLGDTEKEKYYHMKQLVAKVLLNSFYGVLGLPSFRFYDLDNAEAITLTGQQLIKFTAKMGNYYYQNKLGNKDEPVIYTDTDSIFVLAKPMLDRFHPDLDLERIPTMLDGDIDMKTYSQKLVDYLGGGKVLEDKLITNSDKVIPLKAVKIWYDKKFDYPTINHEMNIADAIIGIADGTQKFLNESYDTYAKRFHNTESHRFDIKQELVSKSGFWVKKKRYCQWVINAEGTPADYLDVKGLDVVRSNFPRAFRDFMEEILKDILYGMSKEDLVDKILDFKKQFPKIPILDIMFPTSVKDFTKYIDDDEFDEDVLFGGREKGATGSAKSVLNYNELLVELKFKDNQPISNGDKIKWTYLKGHNPYRIDSLALKGFDDPVALEKYVKDYIDYEKIYEKTLKTKLDAFFKSLAWGSVPSTRLNNQFFKFN